MKEYFDKKDDVLVQMTLLGNQSAFEELVSRYERSVLGTAYKVTTNSFSAEDAAQDAFVSAWINLSALKDGNKFSAWVCSIAKNHAKALNNHYRSSIPDLSINLIENFNLSDNTSFTEQLGEYEELHTAIEALSDKIRETVTLHYFEDLSVKEIAKRLCVTEGTVKWRLSEGRRILRKGYGIMEKTYDENEAILCRVMRQVEQLKLWWFKEDKQGFEAEYKAVLNLVNELPESKEKNYALADTLLMGSWWIPGENNEKMIAKIKRAALDGHNDDVMQSVVGEEAFKIRNFDERIEFMLNTQIPFLKQNNFPKSLAYILFWLGFTYRNKNEHQKAIESFKKVLGTVDKTDVYYAAAKAAIEAETLQYEAKKNPEILHSSFSVSGEGFKNINGKLYFYTQPGYGGGSHLNNTSIFWNCSQIDSLIFDNDLRLGESVYAHNSQNKVTFIEDNAVCDTPAGRFENCKVYLFEGEIRNLRYCKTYFCENIGIVKQEVTRFTSEPITMVLSDYKIYGGKGIIPFYENNFWDYSFENESDGEIFEIINRFEVTGTQKDYVTVASVDFIKCLGYKDTWQGKMIEARQQYVKTFDDASQHLNDVSGTLARAEKLAVTKRQKLHTEIAKDVMTRIFETDQEVNPDYTDLGRWNFFEPINVSKKDNRVYLDESDYTYSFEWKNAKGITTDSDGYQIFYSFFYHILFEGLGYIWSDEWVDGFSFKEFVRYGRTIKNFCAEDCKNIKTPAGEFKNCRHISFELSNYYAGYYNGKSEYWFAENIGIVRFKHYYGENKATVWSLTDYKGEGEGFFPTDDGIFRAYKPENLSEEWNAKVEFTFDTDESGTVIFRNATGTSKRDVN